jgi:dephospho-CoA kinase
MSEHLTGPEAKIIAFVGLTGSGKSKAVEHVTEKGVPKVYFGGVVLDAMREAGLELTEANEREFREELRKREGNDVIVNRIVKQIQDLIAAGQRRIVADGIYTWTEYKVMKHAFPGELTVVAVVAPKHLRYQRLAKREERPLTAAEATSRDWTEIENLEKGGPIAMADYYVHNDKDIEWLDQQIDAVLTHIEF